MGKIKDITGQKFGKLTAIEFIGLINGRYAQWKCLCDCGNYCESMTSSLINSSKKSCGCITSRNTPKDDLVGLKYNMLTVVSYKGKFPTNRPKEFLHHWNCICECGNECSYSTSDLKKRKSCGCLIYNSPSDIIGKRYGYLTVIECLGSRRYNGSMHIFWKCLCDCGIFTEVSTNNLNNNNTESCGCRRYIKEAKDLTGQKFGKLTAIKTTGLKDVNGNFIWEFLCDCGNVCYVPTKNVCGDHKKSCGCLFLESTTKHGMYKSPEYAAWHSMKDRVLNPDSQHYDSYGAIGITIQENWVKDFVEFYEYIGAMPDYESRYSIDRINNNGSYVEGNVRWALPAEQMRNRGMGKNNISGITGVGISHRANGNSYAIAHWSDIRGKGKTKTFSFKKYGETGAIYKATEHRRKMIAMLNKEGAGYTPEHGLPKNIIK